MRPNRSVRIPVALGVGVLAVTGAGVLAAGEAAAATGTVITGEGYVLSVRSAPNSSAEKIGTLKNGDKIEIVCQTEGGPVKGDYGTLTTWNKLPSGGYVADAWIYTGTNGRVAPDCGETGSAPAPAPTGDRKPGSGWVGANPFTGNLVGYCTYGAQIKIREATGSYTEALLGHAKEWAGQARAGGFTVTGTPAERSVVVFTAGEYAAYGHVAWVDKVEQRSDGAYIHITEMNYGEWVDKPNAITTGFNEFTTRVVKHGPGMEYILIP